MKKDLLFIIYSMEIGGDVRSLISLLRSIDYKKYSVDLVMLRNSGSLKDELPKEVHVLRPAINGDLWVARAIRGLRYFLKGYLFKSYYYQKIKKNSTRLGRCQIMAAAQSSVSRTQKKRYDAVIGYMELWPDYYAVSKVIADRYIGWIHVDYPNSGLDPNLDKKYFAKFDHIVCVSEECLDHFNKVFPSFSEKSLCIHNITLPKYIFERSDELIHDMDLSDNTFNIVTVCRLDNKHKGLDRAVIAMKKLKENNYKVKWYVVGEGGSRMELEKMILDNKLENDFILLGQKLNPYPYIKAADVYVMTSRYEGKPIAVTEAQILGIPVITTEYASAREQIRNRVDGIIVPNTDDGIFEALKEVIDKPELLDELRRNLQCRTFGNQQEVNEFYRIIQGN